jgi:hypothetical protein
MALVELTRILPKNKKVKCSVNPNNVVYVQEAVDGDEPGAGSMVFPVAGVEIYVVESYQDVKAKLAMS